MKEKMILTMVLVSLVSFSGTTSYGGVGVAREVVRSILGTSAGKGALAQMSGVPGARIAIMSLEERVRLFEGAFGRIEDLELSRNIDGVLLKASRSQEVGARDLIASLEGYRPNFEISAEDFLALSVGKDFRGANLQMKDLRWMDLKGANLEGALIYQSLLTGMDLKGANLERAKLSGSNLEGANLERASLRRAEISMGHFPGVDFRGADLRVISIGAVNLINAIYNKDTKFPDRFNVFDARKRGMVEME